MGWKFSMAAGCAAAVALWAGQAGAAVQTISFTVAPPWVHGGLGGNPFGVTAADTISGSMQIEDTLTDPSAFVGLNLTTGSKTWTLADIRPGAFVSYFSPGQIHAINLSLGNNDIHFLMNFNAEFSAGFAQLADNSVGGLGSTNITTSLPVIPEPATWALLIAGLGMVGAMLRRRQFGQLGAAAVVE